MNKEQKQQIKQTVKSIGYELIEDYLMKNIVNSPLDIKTEGKSNEEISREITAQEIASKRVMKALNYIRGLAEEEKKDATKYR
jgi:hypothetical protein